MARRYLVVWMKSLEDLLLKKPDAILYIDGVAFIATIASSFAVIHAVRCEGEVKQFVNLTPELTVEFSDIQRTHFIPVLRVDRLEEVDVLALQGP